MQMPSDDHIGWDRLLAAVLGDSPSTDESSDDLGRPPTTITDRSVHGSFLELVPEYVHDEAS